MSTNVLHICQNYNSALYHSMFEEIAKSEAINQIVFYPQVKRVNYNKSDKFHVYHAQGVPQFLRHFFWIRAIVNFINLKKTIDLTSIDIVHCHTLFNDGIIGLFVTAFTKKKLIISVRQSDVIIKKFKIWLNPVIVFLKLKTLCFIFLSPQIKKRFRNIQGKVVGNAADNIFFTTPVPEYRNTPINPRLIYIGQIIKRKKLDVILNSFNPKSMALTVVGKAPQKTLWSKKQLSRFKNFQKITYFNKRTKKQIVKLLDDHDIFVMPSVNETFGIVYIEAMSRGLPILYASGTSIDGLFSSEVGVGIKKVTPKSINLAIKKIVANYQFYSSNAIKEAQDYSWKKTANKIRGCYQM